MSRRNFILLCSFVLIVLFFFPKESGRAGNVSISEMSSCDCFGLDRKINVDQTNVFVNICYGVVYGCTTILDCEDGDCWHKEKGCKCPGTDLWTTSKGSCEAYDGLDSCVCTRGECDKGQAIGG